MRRRIILGLLSVTLFVLAVLEIPLGIAYSDSQSDKLTAGVQRDTFFLANYSEDYIETKRIDRLRKVVVDYEGRTGGRVVVVDATGVVLVDSHPPKPGTRDFSSRPEIRAALLGSVDTRTRRSKTLGGEYIFVTVPIASGGRMYGAVRISYPTSTVDGTVHRYWTALALVALISLAGATALAVVLARGVSRPLLAVEEAATRLGGGDLTARAPDDAGPPEVRSLGRSFNDTAARLGELIVSQEAFVADASHQLRTPLTALRLRLENIEAEVGGEAGDDLAAAEQEVARLSRIVDGLLALARIDRSAPSAVGPVDLAGCVAERVAVWEPVASERTVNLVLRDDGIGRASVSPDRLDQVLDNLLANALDATPPGSTITVRGVGRHGGAELRVTDEGPGLSPADRARAFDRFWRGPETSGGFGGSGLGLAIVHKLVEADGGTVRLDAAAGGGLEAVVTYRSAP